MPTSGVCGRRLLKKTKTLYSYYVFGRLRGGLTGLTQCHRPR